MTHILSEEFRGKTEDMKTSVDCERLHKRIASLTVALGEAVQHMNQSDRSEEGLRIIALCEEVLTGEL